MRILSVDQSYTSSGIVLFEDGVMTHAEIYKSDPVKDTFERAWDITSHVTQLAQKYKPNLISLEGLAFSKFGNATRDLAGLQFALVVTLKFIHKYAISIIPPNVVKKVATGKGNAKKPQLYESLPEGVKLYFKQLGAKKTKGLYDLTDAYWIGRAAIEQNKV